MTFGQWFPAPNPGGGNRETARMALVNWVNAQHIRGLNHFYPSRSSEFRFDEYPGGSGDDYACLAKIKTFQSSEDRLAYTGPVDPGGELVHYATGVQLCHRSYNPDNDQSGESEGDYDRIVDAFLDCLRGVGRDLGRPDIVLMSGEYPRVGGRTVVSDPPIQIDDTGIWQRTGLISFRISQYLIPST